MTVKLSKIDARKTLVLVSLGLIFLWPELFLIKAFIEPPGWFFLSFWKPYLMLFNLEIITALFMAYNFYCLGVELKKEASLNAKMP